MGSGDLQEENGMLVENEPFSRKDLGLTSSTAQEDSG